jgi:hypothetical protein
VKARVERLLGRRGAGRHDPQVDAPLAERARRGLHALCGRRAEARQVALEAVRRAVEVVVAVEQVGAPVEVLGAAPEGGLLHRLGSLQLGRGRTVLLQPGQHRQRLALDRLEVGAGRGQGVDVELPAQLQLVEVDLDVLGQLEVEHQALDQPARTAVGQDPRHQVEVRGLGGHRPRAGPDQEELAVLDLVGRQPPDLALLRHRRRLAVLGERLRRDCAEGLRDQLLHRRRVEVAGDDQAGVARDVVRREEVLDVLQRRSLQVLVAADHRVLVGVARRVQRLGQDQLGDPVGRVLDRLAPLVAHHVALQVELLLRHRVAQRVEPVGVEPEQRRQHRRRAPREVVRLVHAGRGVVRPATRFHQHVELVARDAVRPHEHQVLEQVREAAPPRRLVLGTDGVPDVDRHLGQPLVLVQDHRHPVGQGVGLGAEGEGVARADRSGDQRGGGGAHQVFHGHAGPPNGESPTPRVR